LKLINKQIFKIDKIIKPIYNFKAGGNYRDRGLVERKPLAVVKG